ncbi:potassium channel family protein [Solilutibacter tolerans]|uniref:Ion channel n=1 Tax=Solilutibacter tolerans TaxID=1604334 RepID=A0A1N6TG09_9GAMM|nr:potassium channel family protein [Lysobacter tolerans]SIQ52187.1 Ion channel [Lysobacter tolerans]
MDWLIPDGRLAEHALVAVVALAVTALTVLIHYEGMHALVRRSSKRVVMRGQDRRTMLKIIFSLLVLHVVEIWCFGLAFWGLSAIPGTGYMHGEHSTDTLFDAIYLSATTYTTVGFGDVSPVGAIRFISGLESLVGLILITWSASFTYLEMSRLWSDPDA